MYTNEEPIATLRYTDGVWFVAFNGAGIFGPQAGHEYVRNWIDHGGCFLIPPYDPRLNFSVIAKDLRRRFPGITVRQ